MSVEAREGLQRPLRRGQRADPRPLSGVETPGRATLFDEGIEDAQPPPIPGWTCTPSRPSRPRWTSSAAAPFARTARCMPRAPGLAADALGGAGSTFSTRRRWTSRSRTSPHGLAFVARWNGQTVGDWPYSVGPALAAGGRPLRGPGPPRREPRWRLAALLHDAPEYVIGDLISPVKRHVGPGYAEMDARLAAAIHLRFGLPATLPPRIKRLVKRADAGLRPARGDPDRGLHRGRGDAVSSAGPGSRPRAGSSPLPPRGGPRGLSGAVRRVDGEGSGATTSPPMRNACAGAAHDLGAGGGTGDLDPAPKHGHRRWWWEHGASSWATPPRVIAPSRPARVRTVDLLMAQLTDKLMDWRGRPLALGPACLRGGGARGRLQRRRARAQRHACRRGPARARPRGAASARRFFCARGGRCGPTAQGARLAEALTGAFSSIEGAVRELTPRGRGAPAARCAHPRRSPRAG